MDSVGAQTSYVESVWCATGYCDKNPFQTNSSRHCSRGHKKEKIKQVKRNILAQDKRNKPRSSIQQIMDEARSEESSLLRGFEEEESRQQSDTSILPSNEAMKTSTTRPGLPCHLLSTNNETCPEIGIFYTKNVQGLTGKDKGLE